MQPVDLLQRPLHQRLFSEISCTRWLSVNGCEFLLIKLHQCWLSGVVVEGNGNRIIAGVEKREVSERVRRNRVKNWSKRLESTRKTKKKKNKRGGRVKNVGEKAEVEDEESKAKGERKERERERESEREREWEREEEIVWKREIKEKE